MPWREWRCIRGQWKLRAARRTIERVHLGADGGIQKRKSGFPSGMTRGLILFRNERGCDGVCESRQDGCKGFADMSGVHVVRGAAGGAAAAGQQCVEFE